jgi:hypothetical protein
MAAYEKGSQLVITIDDDNLVTDQDFIGFHSNAGKTLTATVIKSSTEWFNVCELLNEREGRPFYHRGYPMGQRWKKGIVDRYIKEKKVVVNAGFWLEDPDIDALTRMDMPIDAVSLKPEGEKGVVLEKGTWCSFNSQNTALAREVLPAYFLLPYVGRYDDIWAAYFLRVIMDHLGDGIHYGLPLVRQKRNVHNLWVDLEKERHGMTMTDRLISVLKNIKLTGTDYASCYKELGDKLLSAIERGSVFDEDEKRLLIQNIKGMRIWAGVFEKISGRIKEGPK